MSKATAKGYLKTARAAVDQGKWDEALVLSRKALDQDPSSYYGYIFLGMTQAARNEFKDSEDAYRNAIKHNPAESTAWQGLFTLYENFQQVDEYLDAARELAMIYMKK
ncbi:hypothetical protein ABW19_dt0202542 [Dactylella cylindrospora]|nr:hypothetical protein ABW19_dt0202542 [Dactylella cylindrospora]